MEYRSTIDVQAEPARLWDLLTDAPSYPEWNTTVVKVEGTIELGQKIKVFAKVSPNRAFPVKVVELSKAERMVWQGGMPLGLFKGVRTFTLTPQPGGATRFEMHEKFSGPMLGMIRRSMPDLQPSFDEFASALKARAER
jgi:hypothetical protein